MPILEYQTRASSFVVESAYADRSRRAVERTREDVELAEERAWCPSKEVDRAQCERHRHAPPFADDVHIGLIVEDADGPSEPRGNLGRGSKELVALVEARIAEEQRRKRGVHALRFGSRRGMSEHELEIGHVCARSDAEAAASFDLDVPSQPREARAAGRSYRGFAACTERAIPKDDYEALTKTGRAGAVDATIVVSSFLGGGLEAGKELGCVRTGTRVARLPFGPHLGPKPANPEA